jgi:hypothetical protein
LHICSSALGQADQAHAVVDAARAQAALGDFETAAFAEQQVGGRHAHVVEDDFGVAVRRIVEAEHRQVAQDVHARRVARHQDHRLLLVAAGVVGIALAHEDEHGAARVVGAGRPPFAAVDDVMSPSRTMELAMLVASDDATAGSVMPKQERMRPSSSGSSHCFCCSGVP